MPPENISHYRLLELIGRDQAAELYRARDLRLEREVALWLLVPDQPVEVRERFRREAQIASLVTHPHVCAVHDSGEQDGRPFLVCELLEGQTLESALATGALPADRALELGTQLADALVAVHRRGLIHGGVRPASVFVTSDGHVKLLEVGRMSAWWAAEDVPAALDSSSPTRSLDRRAPSDPSLQHFHPWQSPEQVKGERVDERTDVFSTGAVLYHMAAGQPPFSGDTPGAVAGAIVRGAYPPARELNPSVPPLLEGIVDRALAVDPEARYQSVADLLLDLRRARRRAESSSAAAAAAALRSSRKRAAVLVAGLVALALAAVAVARWPWRSSATPTRHSLLVASIANGTNDPDFDGTLREALTVHLGQSPFLDIVSDERLGQILRMMGRQPDAPLTHEVAREACQRLGAAAMLDGSVSAVGRLTIVALVSTDCVTGEPIARNQVEVDRKEAVLGAVGRIASAMRTSLGESVASLERHNVPIEEATTPSLDALKAYTAGVARRAAGAEVESIPLFERAVELDSGFALAYTTLSSIYGGLGEATRGEKYARLAYEHRDGVSDRERLFITYQYHDRVTGDQLKAREALEVWKQSYPLDYRAPNALALMLNRLGEYERAIGEANDAVQRNPAHPFPYSNLAYAYRGAGRFAEARSAADRAVALGIETVPTRRLLFQLDEIEGRTEAARAHLEWAKSRARAFDLTGAQAQVEAFRGRMNAARALYEQTITAAGGAGFAQVGTGYEAQAALTEALYGMSDVAIRRARGIPENTTYAPVLRAAAALAFAGATAEAEAIVARMRGQRPDDTLLHSAYLPVASAAIALRRRDTDAALAALRPAAAYERGSVAALLPIYMRGAARMAGGALDEAVREFRAVLQHRGVDPFSPVIPLSHLGLARALARLGDARASSRAYDDLLAIWKDADPDVPVVREARAERVSGPDRSSSSRPEPSL